MTRPVDKVMFEMKALSRNANGESDRRVVNPAGPLPPVQAGQLILPQSVLRQLFPDLDEDDTDWDALAREAMS